MQKFLKIRKMGGGGLWRGKQGIARKARSRALGELRASLGGENFTEKKKTNTPKPQKRKLQKNQTPKRRSTEI